MELKDVVRKLIGPVDPVGDSNIDRERLKNLMELTTLVDFLVGDIDLIASENTDRVEHSMKTAGIHCSEFLDDLGIEK